MGIQGAGAGSKGVALVSALTTAATVATQVARMVKATESTAGVVRRTSDRMMKDERMILGVILGALGLGFILGFALGRARRKRGSNEPVSDASETGVTAESPKTEPIAEVPQPASKAPTDATEVS